MEPSYHDDLLRDVLAFIDESLSDPALSPRLIAATHHISLRFLYKLFEGHETTVADWIRRRRLQRCRQDLLDPASACIPVSEIGARWGLPDPSQFSRAFRAAYGVSPVECRRQRRPPCNPNIDVQSPLREVGAGRPGLTPGPRRGLVGLRPRRARRYAFRRTG